MNDIITFDELCKLIKDEKHYNTTRACIYEINRMIEDNKVYKLSSNVYKYGSKKNFSIKKNEINVDIINSIINNYDIDFVVWNISILNEWLNHMINSNIVILEVEKTYIEFVFEHLKDKYNVLINPSESEIYNYSTDNTIILKPLITKAPIDYKEKAPKIEKLIVDIFSDKIINYFFDGNERKFIYQRIFDTYAVNYKTLFAYAKRRSIYEELLNYLKKYNLGDIELYEAVMEGLKDVEEGRVSQDPNLLSNIKTKYGL